MEQSQEFQWNSGNNQRKGTLEYFFLQKLTQKISPDFVADTQWYQDNPLAAVTLSACSELQLRVFVYLTLIQAQETKRALEDLTPNSEEYLWWAKDFVHEANTYEELSDNFIKSALPELPAFEEAIQEGSPVIQNLERLLSEQAVLLQATNEFQLTRALQDALEWAEQGTGRDFSELYDDFIPEVIENQTEKVEEITALLSQLALSIDSSKIECTGSFSQETVRFVDYYIPGIDYPAMPELSKTLSLEKQREEIVESSANYIGYYGGTLAKMTHELGSDALLDVLGSDLGEVILSLAREGKNAEAENILITEMVGETSLEEFEAIQDCFFSASPTLHGLEAHKIVSTMQMVETIQSHYAHANDALRADLSHLKRIEQERGAELPQTIKVDFLMLDDAARSEVLKELDPMLGELSGPER